MDETMTKHFNVLRLILYKKYSVALPRIQLDATLRDMGLDSLAMMELSFDIEEAFRISSCDDMKLTTSTVRQLMTYILSEAGLRRAACG
jgi:acyl carrier protein